MIWWQIVGMADEALSFSYVRSAAGCTFGSVPAAHPPTKMNQIESRSRIFYDIPWKSVEYYCVDTEKLNA